MNTYRNISNQDQSVSGVGVVRSGENITVDFELNNPNFTIENGRKYTGVDPVTKPKK